MREFTTNEVRAYNYARRGADVYGELSDGTLCKMPNNRQWLQRDREGVVSYTIYKVDVDGLPCDDKEKIVSYECVTEKGKKSADLYIFLSTLGIRYSTRKYTSNGAIMWAIASTEQEAKQVEKIAGKIYR